MNLYETAGYHINEEQISLQKTEYKETEFCSYKQQYIYRWLIRWYSLKKIAKQLQSRSNIATAYFL